MIDTRYKKKKNQISLSNYITFCQIISCFAKARCHGCNLNFFQWRDIRNIDINRVAFLYFTALLLWRDMLGRIYYAEQFSISRMADNINWKYSVGFFIHRRDLFTNPRVLPSRSDRVIAVKSTSFCENPTLREISAYETAAQSDWRQSGPY